MVVDLGEYKKKKEACTNCKYGVADKDLGMTRCTNKFGPFYDELLPEGSVCIKYKKDKI